ncbi:MAG: hypothetical protein J5685_03115 [Clostridiales bacterium]|nr:hypothetical protein [Clostridiales bacterium]
MNQDEFGQVFSNIMLLAQSLKSECSALCSLIDEEDDIDHVVKYVEMSYHDCEEIMNEIRTIYGNNLDDSENRGDFLYSVASSLVDLIHSVDDTAKDFKRYNISGLRENIVPSMQSCENVADKIIDVAFEMKKIDKSNYSFRTLLDIDHLRNEGVRFYDNQMNELFTTEKDPVEIIKWVAIYKSFKNIFEKCGKFVVASTLYTMYIIR